MIKEISDLMNQEHHAVNLTKEPLTKTTQSMIYIMRDMYQDAGIPYSPDIIFANALKVADHKGLTGIERQAYGTTYVRQVYDFYTIH